MLKTKPKIVGLSLHQPWANMIASREKTIETRMWYTAYRGPLLICSTKKPAIDPSGCAIALVDLIEVRLMCLTDEFAACCGWENGRYAWILENIRPCNNIPVRGRQKLFTVDDLEIEELFETEKGDRHD